MPELASAPSTVARSPRRRRFSRSLSRSRWPEYRTLLHRALALGYQVISLERFVREPPESGGPLLVLRHDVDQHPRSALTMCSIEKAAAVRSTWYFRWRTADPRVIARLRDDGLEVGLHYETLTRRLLRDGTREVDQAMLESCRTELRREIEHFISRFGPISTVCPHGDTRVPGVHNGVLLRDQAPGEFGGVIDCNEAMRGRNLAAWVTDRSAPDGHWGGDLDPLRLLEQRRGPILCLTHPNNWAAGTGLLLDRAVSLVLPGRFPPRPIRTRGDEPFS